MSTHHIKPKQRSRLYCVQALYQWQSVGGNVKDLEFEFLNKREGKISKAFFSDLFLGITSNTDEFNEMIAKYASRELQELGFVEKSILYLGIYELKENLETPFKVVINECLNLAEDIAAEGAYKLINTCLDNIAKELRPFEKK
jgi:N utilization substance protein B